jgi:hypothetical protein
MPHSLISFYFVGWGETVHLVRRPLNGLLYQPRVIDEYGAFGRMRTGRGNSSTRRKPAPAPLCPPQIPHDLTWYRTRAAAVGSWRLTALAMTRPRPTVLEPLQQYGLLATTELQTTTNIAQALEACPRRSTYGAVEVSTSRGTSVGEKSAEAVALTRCQQGQVRFLSE